ncbi:fasciclin domain-containing protein [Persicitalea sp.]|uniref:fasciclin domain-containing protein n=1 Tax=Persicitalea sp. TaxID=3100273 RepID=UPI003593BE05
MKKMRVFGSSLLKLFVVALLFVSVSACKDKDKNRVKPMTIADVIADDGDFTILAAAIRHADLGDALRSGSLTLLAPNDAAFRASGFADAGAITSRPSGEIRDLLKYHVLTTSQSQAEIANANGKTIPNLAEKPSYVTVNGAGEVLINGVRIIQADRKADNGTIHVVERVLQPISRNLVEELKVQSNLTFALAAAERAAEANSTLRDIFTSPNSQYTFFAPNNQAFINEGFPTAGSLSAADKSYLANILLNHIVPGRLLANNLTSGDLATAAPGKSVKVETNNGIKITAKNNGAKTANVGQTNILATNGVIHVIDRLLVK